MTNVMWPTNNVINPQMVLGLKQVPHTQERGGAQSEYINGAVWVGISARENIWENSMLIMVSCRGVSTSDKRCAAHARGRVKMPGEANCTETAENLSAHSFPNALPALCC